MFDFVVSQVWELESQSDLMFEEGLLNMISGRGQEGVAGSEGVGQEVVAGGEGSGHDPNLTGLWECYYNWSLERYEENSFKAVRKRVCD